jgi:nucleoside-diphosphate-sugar epimerase
MARKILVTGGTGLLGRKLMSSSNMEFMKVGSELDLLGDEGPELILELAKQNECDTLLHLAWKSNSVPDYEKSLENSQWVSASIQIARKCIQNGVSFVGIGTGLEEDPAANSEYAQSKRALRELLEKEIGLENLAWIRPFYIFDILEMRPRIVEALFKQSALDPLVIRFGSTKIDYISSIDVANGIVEAISAGSRGIVDIGSGRLISNRDFVNAVCKNENVEVPLMLDASSGMPHSADLTSLSSLGWSPSHTNRYLSL